MQRRLSIQGGTVIFNDGEIGIMLRSSQGEVGQDVRRRAYAVQKRMKRLAPKWSGELERGIRVESVRETPNGPASRVISDAPHTLVAEVGRGPVIASGAVSTSALRSRSSLQLSGSQLRWGSDRSGGGRPQALTVRLSPHGDGYFAVRVGPAAGSRFMEGSIDAAID